MAFSEENIRDIADGEGGKYFFDLSVIDSYNYESLFKMLPQFGVKKIDQLGFNCDEMNKKKILSTRESIENSIAYTRHNYLHNTTELLYFILTHSKRLTELCLSNLPFTSEQIIRIADGLKCCSTLEKITFNKIALKDSGLSIILRALQEIEPGYLSFKYCRLTQNSVKSIAKFIRAENGAVRSFTCSKQEIGDSGIATISSAIESFQPRITHQHHPNPECDQTEIEMKQLSKENEELRAELESLKKRVEIVQYNEQVYVVGKGAHDFIKFINSIESHLAELEQ